MKQKLSAKGRLHLILYHAGWPFDCGAPMSPFKIIRIKIDRARDKRDVESLCQRLAANDRFLRSMTAEDRKKWLADSRRRHYG